MQDLSSASRPVLVVEEQDLPASLRSSMKATAQGTRVLGGAGDGARAFWDGVLEAVVRRAGAVAPEGFRVRELEINLDVEGKLFGTGISGSVSVTLEPTR